MKKIPSLFKRDFGGNPKFVTKEIDPACQWVVDGEGVATRKWDGTACLIKDGKLWKRYDQKKGRAPLGQWFPAQEPDPVTGHWPGWAEVCHSSEDQWHIEALKNAEDSGQALPDGTYELLGPKIQGNPEKMPVHVLEPHGVTKLEDAPRSYDGLKEYLRGKEIEGIVWHHPDRRMAKIKKKDFDYTMKDGAHE